MQKAASLSFALVLIVSGCGESTTGDGGADGTGGDAGAGGSAGDGGSAGSGGGGQGGTGGSTSAEAEAEYRTACLHDEPDTPLDCLNRKLRHYERECGELHLAWTKCINDLGGQDPFDDCGPLLDDWNECFERAYPEQSTDVPCSGGAWSEWQRYAGGRDYFTDRWRYLYANRAAPPNRGARRIEVAVCNVALDWNNFNEYEPCYAEGSSSDAVQCSLALFENFNQVLMELDTGERPPYVAQSCADAAISIGDDGSLDNARCGYELDVYFYDWDTDQNVRLTGNSWAFAPSVVRVSLTERTEAP